MRQHKYRRMVRRIVAPPTFPCIARPLSKAPGPARTCYGPGSRLRHFRKTQSHIVIDTFPPFARTVYFLKRPCLKNHVHLETANPQGIMHILPGPGAKPIQRN